MKIQALLLILLFAVSDSFSQENDQNQSLTRVHHYKNNISIVYADGTRATIYLNGNSADLVNTDGTQSTINLSKNSSTLTAMDGTHSTIFFNGSSSAVTNADGTHLTINHMQRTSSCWTEDGKQVITHTFGNLCEMKNKKVVDVLIHTNWFVQKRLAERIAEANKMMNGK